MKFPAYNIYIGQKFQEFPKILTELQIFLEKMPSNMAPKRHNARLVVYSLIVDLGASPGA
jgi:hypothetical protein